MDNRVRGRFVWHELMTTDIDRAMKFYTAVVGWKAQAWGQGEPYTIFTTKEGMMAGLMALPEDAKAMGAPPSWLCYIGTPDVDQTVVQARGMGATVLKEPTDIPSVGRFAVLQDPQGASFTAFTPIREAGGEGSTLLGDFSWHELMTRDWPAAFGFYQALFGWEKTESMDMGPEAGMYQMFGWPGKSLGGMMNKPPQVSAPPHWLPYALVEDCRKLIDTVIASGGSILHGPMEVPGGDWVVQIMDPQGAVFAIHSRKPVEKPRAAAPPAAKPAAVKKPAAKKPAAKKPAVKKPAAKKPAAKKPAAKKPAAKKPAAKKPAAKKPAAKKPAAKKPAVKKPAAKKPVAKKPVAKKPAAKRTVGKKPAARKPAAKKPVRKKPAAKKPAARKR